MSYLWFPGGECSDYNFESLASMTLDALDGLYLFLHIFNAF